MQDIIAAHLLTKIYYPVSALVCATASGGVLSLLLFDTLHHEPDVRIEPDAEEIWLMTNHPDGCPDLYEADKKNLEHLRMTAGTKRIRVYIANEDSGVTRISV